MLTVLFAADQPKGQHRRTCLACSISHPSCNQNQSVRAENAVKPLETAENVENWACEGKEKQTNKTKQNKTNKTNKKKQKKKKHETKQQN